MLKTTITILQFKIHPEFTKGNVEGLKIDYVCDCELDDEANIEHSNEYISSTPIDWLNILPQYFLTVLNQLREKAEEQFQQSLNSQLLLN